jgi:hypothetical protein
MLKSAPVARAAVNAGTGAKSAAVGAAQKAFPGIGLNSISKAAQLELANVLASKFKTAR